MLSETLTEIMNLARTEDFGYLIETNNPQQMVYKLQEIKRNLRYTDLQICLPALENTVFIVRKSVEL